MSRDLSARVWKLPSRPSLIFKKISGCLNGREMKGFSIGGEGATYLHTKIRIRHPAIYSKFRKLMSTVLLHCIQYGLCLETRRLECGSRNMTLLCECRYADCNPLIMEPRDQRPAFQSDQNQKWEISQIVPRASSIQYGANNPLKAVTNTQPPLSSTVSANSLTFALESIKPRLFCRNLTLEPATPILPSNAYCGTPSKSYATVESKPCFEITGLEPT